jgi:CBS domain-containing protein
MKISDVVRHKGDHVVTVKPGDSVEAMLEVLAEYSIGAVVVSADGSSVDGIVSERDVVRQLVSSGREMLGRAVSDIMTSEVQTAGLEDDVVDIATSMTNGRFRHMPVVVGGKLRGIVSLGDVVKHRLEEIQAERDQLIKYIQQ